MALQDETPETPEMSVLEAEIGTLTLEAGDVLAVIFKEPITDAGAYRLQEEIKRSLPTGVGVIIFCEDVKLAVIKPVLEDGAEYACFGEAGRLERLDEKTNDSE